MKLYWIAALAVAPLLAGCTPGVADAPPSVQRLAALVHLDTNNDLYIDSPELNTGPPGFARMIQEHVENGKGQEVEHGISGRDLRDLYRVSRRFGRSPGLRLSLVKLNTRRILEDDGYDTDVMRVIHMADRHGAVRSGGAPNGVATLMQLRSLIRDATKNQDSWVNRQGYLAEFGVEDFDRSALSAVQALSPANKALNRRVIVRRRCHQS